MKYDAQGREIVSSVPCEVGVPFTRPPSLSDEVRRLVRGAMSQQAASEGNETFEEADDFDIPDDPVDMSSPWEENFDGDQRLNAAIAELRENEKLKASQTPPAKPAEPQGPGREAPDVPAQ